MEISRQFFLRVGKWPTLPLTVIKWPQGLFHGVESGRHIFLEGWKVADIGSFNQLSNKISVGNFPAHENLSAGTFPALVSVNFQSSNNKCRQLPNPEFQRISNSQCRLD